jgi:hypothetical protein
VHRGAIRSQAFSGVQRAVGEYCGPVPALGAAVQVFDESFGGTVTQLAERELLKRRI